MKPYYKVFVSGSDMSTFCTSLEVAKEERKALQGQGLKKVYINKKKGESRVSDYHQGGY